MWLLSPAPLEGRPCAVLVCALTAWHTVGASLTCPDWGSHLCPAPRSQRCWSPNQGERAPVVSAPGPPARLPGLPTPRRDVGPGLTPAAPNLLPDSSEHPFPQLRVGDWARRGVRLLPAPAGLLASGATLHNGLAGHRGHGVDPGCAPQSWCDRGPAAYPPRPPFSQGNHGEIFGCRAEPQCRGPGRQRHMSAPPARRCSWKRSFPSPPPSPTSLLGSQGGTSVPAGRRELVTLHHTVSESSERGMTRSLMAM